jgi:hypothetical protein
MAIEFDDEVRETQELAIALTLFFHEQDANPNIAVAAMATVVGAVEGNDGDWDQIVARIASITKVITRPSVSCNPPIHG